MWFASPLWLIALVPWAGVTLWLLWGRFARTEVPYLELWRGAIEERPKRPGLRRPPLPLLFGIVAMLLAILAAAGPTIWGAANSGTPLQVVLDRGRTMSGSSQGALRFRTTATLLADELNHRAPRIPVHLLAVPGNTERSTDASELSRTVAALAATGLRTGGSLDQAVEEALRSGDEAIFVLTDQPIRSADPRIVRIAPDALMDDVGISLISARETPIPQVMVRVLNQTSRITTTLDVMTAGQRLRQAIELPPRGASRDYFFAPRELGETIEAALAAGDELRSDDRAWLARSSVWPAIESRVALDPSVERMVGVYAMRRPPGAGSPTIQIVGDNADLPGERRGIVITRSFADAAASGAGLEVSDHAITRGINWGALPLMPAATEPPSGWEPLVRSGGRVVLASQAEPARRVWIGFATDQWATQAQFVIFWTNVFDWIGQAGRQFSSAPLEERTDDWQPLTSPAGFPGIYRRGDGVERAFNTLADRLQPPEALTRDWRQRLGAAARRHAGRSISGPLAVVALLCLLCAVSTWRKRPSKDAHDRFADAATGKM